MSVAVHVELVRASSWQIMASLASGYWFHPMAAQKWLIQTHLYWHTDQRNKKNIRPSRGIKLNKEIIRIIVPGVGFLADAIWHPGRGAILRAVCSVVLWTS